MTLSKRERDILKRLVASDGASFAKLVELAGLNPTCAFRGADMRGVAFGETDLAGFDFTGADLSGASLEHARIVGAIFTHALTADVRWPAPLASELKPIQLSAMQSEAITRMIGDLESKRRAIALMPTGTGRGQVLEEVIVNTIDRHARGILLVDTAAERDQFAHRLRARLGHVRIWTTKEASPLPRDGLLVHNTSYRDFQGPRLPELIAHFAAQGCVFTTSVEKINQLMRSEELLLKESLIATVDVSPIDADRPDRRRLAARVRRLFGAASFVCEIEEAVDRKLLQPTDLIAHFDIIRRSRETLRRPDLSAEHLYTLIRPVAERLLQIYRDERFESLLVLCRDDQHAEALSRSLKFDIGFHPDNITPLGIRWKREQLPIELARWRGIIVAPISRQSIQTAQQHPWVVVATPLGVARAQDLAFRPVPHLPSEFPRPQVHDLADAFDGFTGRDFDTTRYL